MTGTVVNRRLQLTFALLLSLSVPPAGAHPGAAQRIQQLNDLIATYPGSQQLYILRGQAFSNEGMYPLALADFHKAETLGDPTLVAFDKGVALYRSGELMAAHAELDRFLARFPRHASALEYRARVSRDAGDQQAAIEDFRAYFALKDNPNPGDYVSAAHLLEELDDGGPDAALHLLDQGIAKLGLIPQLQQQAVAIESRRGQWQAAIARHASLQGVLADSPDWKVDMGELQFRAGHHEAARSQLSAASGQLAGLRQTGARKALASRIEALQAALSDTQQHRLPDR